MADKSTIKREHAIALTAEIAEASEALKQSARDSAARGAFRVATKSHDEAMGMQKAISIIQMAMTRGDGNFDIVD